MSNLPAVSLKGRESHSPGSSGAFGRASWRGAWVGARALLPLMIATVALTASGRSLHATQTATGLPAVIFRFEPELQAVVGGATGQRANPADDVRWAEQRAGDLLEFYRDSGGRFLRLVAEYAGVPWPYREIDVYLVRRFPTLSIQYPLTIATGTIEQGQSRQDVPGDDFLILTFAHQITHYLLDPPPEELAADRPRALDHPLLEEGTYRREALVNLVTYRALEDLWGRTQLRRVVAQPLWQSYNPQGAFMDSLQSRWTLSRSRPLVTWLLGEGDRGRVVDLAERMEERARAGGDVGDVSGRPPGAVSGSDIGFDLGETADGKLFIAFLDRGTPAEAAGLRAGDIVVTVEGRRFSNVQDAMAAVREAWETNGEVNVSVERQGREVFFQIH